MEAALLTLILIRRVIHDAPKSRAATSGQINSTYLQEKRFKIHVKIKKNTGKKKLKTKIMYGRTKI